jgi:hypothetical protein
MNKLNIIIKKIINIIIGSINNIFNLNTTISNPRLKICNSCEYKKNIKGIGNICTQCGCILKSKTSVESEHCVLNKW